ncbi:MAG: tetratricopeptide repeat protein [Rhodocyclales bacterium]|nr:tetratricopeptide repeat protein [Rhodocyclales bacterium]
MNSYRQAIAFDPGQVAAHRDLGFVLMNLGQTDAAEQCFRNALASAEVDAAALQGLGIVAAQRGDLTSAEALLRRALAADGDNAAIYANLGTALSHQGRSAEAVAAYRRASVLEPAFAEAHFGLGNALQSQGKVAAAIDAYDAAISLQPHSADFHNNRAAALNTLGRFEEAEQGSRQALALGASNHHAYNNLGNALHGQARGEEAIACYQKAIDLRRDYAEAHNNLGRAFLDLGRIEEAEAAYRQALHARPEFAAAIGNLGLALQRLGRLDEAESCQRQALQLNPDLAAAHANLGYLLHDMSRLHDAEASYRRALQIAPEDAETHCNLGIVLQHLGRQEEAEASYRQALQLKPDYAGAYSNLLLASHYRADRHGEATVASHREYDRRFGTPLRQAWPVHGNTRDPERRLRIGYVSPDFRQHSVAYFIEPLLREHDGKAVELYCYADVGNPDAVTRRLQQHADRWLTTVGMSDAALAQRIADDGIDILVDLAGHTAHNRLLAFARKPAPIQVSWLGYPHSTGLSAMDYRLVDAVTDPPGEADAAASEALIRLDSGFLCYEAPTAAPVPAPPPSLGGDGITFGSFNNPAKLSPPTLDAWAQLLERVPNSRLLVKGKCFGDAGAAAEFLARLAQRGVDAQRVILLGLVAAASDHLAAYAQVDIALDPFPYNGTTTTCEALWMGVPVVSRRGDRHAGRVGASLLAQIELTELVAASTPAYVDIATALAADGPRLQELRRTLRARMTASPLCAAPAFARKIEAAYRAMWRRHCDGEDPRAGDVAR